MNSTNLAETENLRAFLDVAPDAIVIVDDHGTIVSVNHLAEEMFGYSRDDLVGRTIEMLVPERHRHAHSAHRQRYAEAPRTRSMGTGQQLSGRRKDGTEFPVEISLSPFKTAKSTQIISIIRDITAQKEAEAKFRNLLESAPDGIVVVDESGTIVIVNSQAEKMFGYSRDEMIGKRVEMLVPERYQGVHGSHRTAYTREPRTRPMGAGRLLTGRRKDGSEFPVEISLSPLQSEQGILITSIIRDVTDRLHAEEERRALDAARMRAEEINRAKDQFLMTLSHELRTPLTAIVGWSRLLRMGTVDAETMQTALEAIQNSADAQARLIDDVLQTSGLIAGKIELSLSTVDPVAVAHAALQTVRPMASTRRVRTSIEVDPQVGLILADPTRLQQIIWNLLSNAIKFSPKDSVVLLKMMQQESSLVVEVSDSGEGIAAEFLPFIFEPFLQADSSTTRVYGGLGLGLSIVRQLTELHGGRVMAESGGKGKGSKFRVMIPVRAVAVAPSPRPVSLPEQLPTLAGHTVLYVDDDEESRRMLEVLLQQSGAKSVSAASVDEAMSILEKVHADVIITDIAMPHMDGYDLLKAVRERWADTPVIALTALARLDEARNPVIQSIPAQASNSAGDCLGNSRRSLGNPVKSDGSPSWCERQRLLHPRVTVSDVSHHGNVDGLRGWDRAGGDGE